jgi:hypothetical protein
MLLFTHPNWDANGSVAAELRGVRVPRGARSLVAKVGFVSGAEGTNGAGAFISFLPDGSTRALEIWTTAIYDGEIDTLSIDLSSMGGRTGTVQLFVSTNGNSGCDWVCWKELSIR